MVVILAGILITRPAAGGQIEVEGEIVGFEAELLPFPVDGAPVYFVAVTAVRDDVVHPDTVAST